jgi:hypothetical protein
VKLRKEQVLSLKRCRGVKLSFSDTGNWSGRDVGKRTQAGKDRFDWGKF